MSNKILIIALLSVILSTGCTVRAPGVKLDLPGVEIGTKDRVTHCPPGQAKKGRC
jgi:hypothetical protein